MSVLYCPLVTVLHNTEPIFEKHTCDTHSRKRTLGKVVVCCVCVTGEVNRAGSKEQQREREEQNKKGKKLKEKS